MSVYLDHVNNNISASSGNLTINGVVPQTSNNTLTSVAALSTISTGLVKLTNGVASLDTTSYLTSIPVASTSVLGGVMVDGTTLVVNSGVISVQSSSLLPSQTGNSGKYLTTNGTVASWATISGGSGGLVPTLTQTANYTAYVNDMVLANATSASFNITLPASPANGAVVAVVDVALSFSNHNVTVLPGAGATVDSTTSSKLSTNGSYTQFVYISSTTNWQTQTTAGSGSADIDGGSAATVYTGLTSFNGGNASGV